MNLFFWNTRDTPETSDEVCRIEIARPVIDRIHRILSKSDVEEGGKFLGRIVEKEGNLLLRIQTFLDSGPRVDNSRVHLHPNGEYQEAAYRLLEMFDPDIEHLGSWHSHHCNGLNQLSQNDIVGYNRSVNDPNYRLQHFFVMLVTALRPKGLYGRYYLFTKSASDYQELPSEAVHIVKQEYDYERLIQEAERAAVASRPLRNLNRAPALPPNTSRSIGEEDGLQEVRKEDAAWLRKVFPLAQIVQNSRDQTYAWRWTVGPLRIHWRYPKMINSPVTAHGLL